MKLLFDQNLSPRLVSHLADLYPDSLHVEYAGLGEAADKVVWEFARQSQCLIVTKDADFSDLSLLYGFPPKVVWVRRRNCPTKDIEVLLRQSYTSIQNLEQDAQSGIIMLF